jgi:hypothetical protein
MENLNGIREQEVSISTKVHSSDWMFSLLYFVMVGVVFDNCFQELKHCDIPMEFGYRFCFWSVGIYVIWYLYSLFLLQLLNHPASYVLLRGL